MKAVTFYFWNMESTPNIYRFVQPFLPFMVDLTFGNILDVWDKSQLYINGCISSRAKDSIYANAQVSALEKMQSKTLRKKSVITLIFKLKAIVIYTKFDLAQWQRDILNLTLCCLSCHKNLGLNQEIVHQ